MAAFNCKAKTLETLPAPAVSVTDCAVVTEAAVAVKPALVAPAGTVTVAGSVTAALLLERLTLRPPVCAAAVEVTVQASLAEPVKEALVQETALRAATATPVPLRLTVFVVLVDALLVMANWPVTAPAAVGSNFTVSAVDWPGFSVTGRVAPETVKPAPVTATALTITGKLLDEVRVTTAEIGRAHV
jgi:hypothetical protein